jgi:methylglutaconyl-CoA hydratase
MQTPSEYSFIRVTQNGALLQVELARPEVHNAFNAQMIAELTHAFSEFATPLNGATAARLVAITGEGQTFCAGADVNWMRASLQYSVEENRADAARMAAMFKAIDECPLPVVALVQGAALGGGAGLVAVSDIVIAEEGAKFAFSEVKLGIAPAVISPFVLAKIGRSHARALFLTGERFSAQRAQQIGLVHQTVPTGGLNEALEQTLSQIATSGPQAVSRAKSLITQVAAKGDAATDLTVQTIAELRAGPEGQEGLRAFLDKRKPEWAS